MNYNNDKNNNNPNADENTIDGVLFSFINVLSQFTDVATQQQKEAAVGLIDCNVYALVAQTAGKRSLRIGENDEQRLRKTHDFIVRVLKNHRLQQAVANEDDEEGELDLFG
jgi:hypothetical protein